MKHHDIVSPVLTAVWSKKLKDIVDGTLSPRQFYVDMQRYIIESTEAFKAIDMEVAEKETVVVGACKTCGGQVIEGFKGYQCTTKGCKFFISKVLMKAKITPNDARKLLTGKETREIRFTWKSGKKGKAKLKLEDDKLQFVFADPKK